MDPDNPDPAGTSKKRNFGNWLRLSTEEIRKAGYMVNDKNEMVNVYITDSGN